MRVLVTGTGGFVGRHLIPRLLAEGHEIACLTRRPDELPTEWQPCPRAASDIDGQGVRTLCQTFRPEVAIHLAALYINDHGFQDIRPLVEANLLLGAHLLEAMRESGCDALVWAGTSWQHYGGADYNPVNLYAATKQAFSTLAEYYLQTAGLRMLELHLYDSYGEGDARPRLLNTLQASAQRDEPIGLTPGEQRMHLVHIDDLVKGFVAAAKQVCQQAPGTRTIFRLPAPQAVSIRELVETFNAADPAHPLRAQWGVRNYRPREIFSPWEAAPVLPGWQPTIDLPTGLRRIRTDRSKPAKQSTAGESQ